MALEQWKEGFSQLHHAIDTSVGSKCEQSVAVAMKLCDIIQSNLVLRVSLDKWVRALLDMNDRQMDEVIATSCGELVDILPDFPMLLGLGWLACQNGDWDFARFRSFVHLLRLRQITRKIGITNTPLPSKVHQVIEMHADFVPSVAALCVFHATPRSLKPFSKYLVDMLRPVWDRDTHDLGRIRHIFYDGLIDDLRESSLSVRNVMLEMVRVMDDYMFDVGDDLVVSSKQRLRKLPEMDQMYDARIPSDDEMWLSLRLLFVQHTTDERDRLIHSLTENESDALKFAMSCIQMPTKMGLELLPMLFKKITLSQMLRCARAMNALPCDRLVACIDDTDDIVDGYLSTIADVAHSSLQALNSEMISMLNATVTVQVPGRWLDMLAKLLDDDEQRAFNNYGDGATVITGANATVHRLLFLNDLTTLLETFRSTSAILIATFYTSDEVPFTFAREVALDDTAQGAVGAPSDVSMHGLTRAEQRARFAHKCFEEIRMHKRPKPVPIKVEKNGLVVDDSTMPPLELMMRKEANAILSEYIDFDEAVVESDDAVSGVPESIEFVQLDLYGKRELSKTDMSAIDIQSSDALTKTVVMRRQHGFTETSWPYRMSTGCQMSLVQVSDSKPMDSQFDTQLVAAFQLLGVQ